MSTHSYEKAAELLAHGLIAIAEAVSDARTAESGLAALGWAPPPATELVPTFALDSADLGTKLQIVLESTPNERANDEVMAERYGALAAAVALFIAQIDTLANALPGKLAAAGDYAQRTNISAEFPRRLSDFLLVRGIHYVSPTWASLLHLTGVFTAQHYPRDDSIYQVDHTRLAIDSHQLPLLVSNPGQAFANVYGWGTATFDAESLLNNAGLVLATLGARTTLLDMPARVQAGIGEQATAFDPGETPQLLVELLHLGGEIPVDARLSLHRLRRTSAGATDAGMELAPYVRGAVNFQVPLTDALNLLIDADIDLDAGVGIALRPSGVKLRSGLLTGTVASVDGNLGVGLELAARPDGHPRELLSGPGGIALTFDGAEFEVGVEAVPGDSPDAYGRAALRGGKLVVGSKQADGFLQHQLPETFETDFDIGVRWSQRNGLTIEGSAQLDWHLPLHVIAGPLSLDELHVRLGAAEAHVTLDTTVTGTLTLGPVTASVQDVGARAQLALERGSLGPTDLTIAFRPPTGAGLRLGGSVLSGSGFLSHDEATQSYTGALQVDFRGISLQAVGLLTTRQPSGAPIPGLGFSLLIIITARFPPIQLGLGFALTGVGGLVGLNRTTSVDPLRAGLKDGSVNSILFPADLATKPEKVVGDLGRFFPVAPGQFIVGPMVEVIWGTGGIVTARIGILIEFPAPTRVVLLGQVHLMLPAPAAPVVDITLDILGVLDFSARTLALDAVLRNSRVAAFTLTGSAAIRAAWGDQPTFLLAVGGFHPRFTPPASFPKLDRVQLALGDSNNPRLRLSAYLALTTNTAQIGAALDLFASVDIPVVGTFAIAAQLGFDALFQFSPFAFSVDVDASVLLLWNNNPFLGVALHIALTGPHPWHAVGQATFSCFGTHSVAFQLTIGERPAVQPRPTVDLEGSVRAAIADPKNWSANPPTGGRHQVQLSSTARPNNRLLLHPRGTATVQQKYAPLDVNVTRVGTAAITGATRLTITSTALGTNTEHTDAKDYFAPAQYLDLTDDEKLSRPSFERMVNGVVLTTPSNKPPPPSTWRSSAVTVESHQMTATATGTRSTVRLPDHPLSSNQVVVQNAASIAAEAVSPFAGVQVGVTIVPPSYTPVDPQTLAPTAPTVGLETYTAADQQRVGGQIVIPSSDVYAEAEAAVPPDIDPNAYYVLTAVHSGKNLETRGDSLDSGAPIQQWAEHPHGNQYWRFVPLGDGTHMIVSEHSAKVLDATAYGSANGTPIQQWEPLRGPNQRWRISLVETGHYRIASFNGDRCLDVVGGLTSTADGALIQLWDWWGGENQKWRLTKVSIGRVLRQRIEERAYQRWVARGRPFGHSAEDWTAAQEEILRPILQLEAYVRYEQRGRQPGHAIDHWLAAERTVEAQISAAGGGRG